MIFLLLLMLAMEAGAQPCITVDQEWVTVREVVGRVPQYAGLDPELRLVRAPFPGARRVVGPGTLPTVESSEAITPFCIERRLETLPRELFAEALRKTLLGKDDAEIHFELVDYDRAMVPSGHLEFLTQALPPPVLGHAEDPVLWRGKMIYAEGHSVPVWVRVRLWIEAEACVLKRDVARGEELVPGDCQMGRTRYPPFAPPPLREAAGLERTSAARRMRAGEPLYQALVVHKPDVEAGKAVELKVVSGGAQLRFQAKAATSGRRGDAVAVTNPANGKRLEGQVTGQGAVEVHLK